MGVDRKGNGNKRAKENTIIVTNKRNKQAWEKQSKEGRKWKENKKKEEWRDRIDMILHNSLLYQRYFHTLFLYETSLTFKRFIRSCLSTKSRLYSEIVTSIEKKLIPASPSTPWLPGWVTERERVIHLYPEAVTQGFIYFPASRTGKS